MADLPASGSAKRTTLAEDVRALIASPRDLWLVYLATLFEFLGVYATLPTLPLWLTSDFGMSDQRAGWWTGAFSTVLTIFVFVVGSIADAIGVRTTLLLSLALAAAARLAMALAPAEGPAIAALLSFGLAYAMSKPVLQTAVQRASDERTRAFAFSLWYVSFNVSAALSGPFVIDVCRRAFLDHATGQLVRRAVRLPILGERMMTANGAIMGTGVVFAALAFVVVLALRKDFEHRTRPGGAAAEKRASPLAVLRDVLGDRAFWRFMVLLFFLAIVRMTFQHMYLTWPKYIVREQGESFPVGAVWSLNSVLILVLAPLGTVLTRDRAPFQVVLLGALISAVSPFILCFGSTMPLQIAMAIVLTVGEALWSPRLYEYNVAIAPRGREATYVSLAALPQFLSTLLVGPASGYLLATFCPASGPRHAQIMWALIGASTLIGPLGIWLGRDWLTSPPPDRR